jgi:hypothetical protein
MSVSMGGIISECPGDFVGIRTLNKKRVMVDAQGIEPWTFPV